jgi:hypothetical protein
MLEAPTRHASRKVVADEDGRPKSRCWSHGGAPGSGRQTPEGRRRIAAAVSRHMKGFWADWKAKGSPPICVGQPKPAPVGKSSLLRPKPKPIVLSPDDIEFGIKTGMLKR